MNIAWQFAGIALGGALGALARYGIYLWLHPPGPPTFPYGTLVANAVGCFLAGIMIASGVTEKSETIRLLIGVGFLGALTTFSTFSVETVNYLRMNQFALAMTNVGANLFASLSLTMLGAMLGRWIGPPN